MIGQSENLSGIAVQKFKLRWVNLLSHYLKENQLLNRHMKNKTLNPNNKMKGRDPSISDLQVLYYLIISSSSSTNSICILHIINLWSVCMLCYYYYFFCNQTLKS